MPEEVLAYKLIAYWLTDWLIGWLAVTRVVGWLASWLCVWLVEGTGVCQAGKVAGCWLHVERWSDNPREALKEVRRERMRNGQTGSLCS